MCPQGPKNICIFSFQRDLKLQYELFKLVLNILSSLLNTNGCFKHISLLGKKKTMPRPERNKTKRKSLALYY